MRENNAGFRRRSFLKTAATTGALATGLAASAGVASADGEHCVEFRVEASEDNTDYRLEFRDHLHVKMGDDTESNDSQIDTNIVEGTLHDGYKDTYWVEEEVCYAGYLWHVELDGNGCIMWCNEAFCDENNYLCAVPDDVQIDVTGTGDYTFGWWKKNTLVAENNVEEGGEIEACYPTYSDTGDPQLTCEIDPEGVVTRTIDPPNDDPYDADFGTGWVDGWTDTFHTEGNDYEGAYFVRGNGNITVDLSYL